jgi:hypothetical protein
MESLLRLCLDCQDSPGPGRDVEADTAERQLAELTASDPQFAAIEARLAAVMKGGGLKDNAERVRAAPSPG